MVDFVKSEKVILPLTDEVGMGFFNRVQGFRDSSSTRSPLPNHQILPYRFDDFIIIVGKHIRIAIACGLSVSVPAWNNMPPRPLILPNHHA